MPHLFSKSPGKLIPYLFIVNANIGHLHIRNRRVIRVYRNPQFLSLQIIIPIVIRINRRHSQSVHLHFQQIPYHFLLYFFIRLCIRGEDNCFHIHLLGRLFHTGIDRHPIFTVPGFCHHPYDKLPLRFLHILPGAAAHT